MSFGQNFFKSVFFVLSTSFLMAPLMAQKRSNSTPTALSYEKLQKIVQAQGAYLIDVTTGTVLFKRNENRPYLPASTVKLMTALLVFELKKGIDGKILISPDDTRVEPSHVPLIPGEVVEVRDLVKALLVGSDNDTAMALARYSAGNVNRFVSLMNERALRLGCQRTRFVNPNGLPGAGQFTTASDLMKIFEAVLRISELNRICQLKNFSLNTRVGSQTVKNHNKLLGVYPGMGPAKTGWTYSSQHTYAASAMRNGRELRLTLLKSSNKWVDAQALFDYGFANLPPIQEDPLTKLLSREGEIQMAFSQ